MVTRGIVPPNPCPPGSLRADTVPILRPYFITMAGSTHAKPLATCELRVGGMDCASCAATIERALRQLDGVEEVRVDVVGGRVRVSYEAGAVGRPV